MQPSPLPPALADLDDRTPRGIAGVLARLITAGELAPGDRLPTVRDVAAALGVSPATVSEAWQALRRAGLVVARGRAGTFVLDQPRTWLSPRHQGLMGDSSSSPLRLDLSRGLPDPALLPSIGPALSRVSASAGVGRYQDLPVLPELHEVLLASWPWTPGAITVVDGAQDGVERVLQQVVTFGGRVVLESPGYPPFFDLVEALGAEVVPVELDGEGVRVDSLRAALATRPAAVVLQPRAHNPTGVSITASRAASLARLLRRREHADVLVLEDDHSALISGAPDASLGALLPGRVVQVRSFSKSHGPELRIAALGGPSAIIDAVVARRMLGPGWTSRLNQAILLDLLTHATSLDAVGEAARQYFGRQRDLVAHLARLGVQVAQPDGINLWLPVREDRAAQLDLAAAGIRAASGAPFLAPGHTPGDFLRVTTGLVTPADSADVAAALAHAVNP